MPSVTLNVSVQVSMVTMTFFLSATPKIGIPDMRIGSKGGGSEMDGTFAGKAGTGGKLSSIFSDGRRLGVGLTSGDGSNAGVVGTARVGHGGVYGRRVSRCAA